MGSVLQFGLPLLLRVQEVLTLINCCMRLTEEAWPQPLWSDKLERMTEWYFLPESLLDTEMVQK